MTARLPKVAHLRAIARAAVAAHVSPVVPYPERRAKLAAAVEAYLADYPHVALEVPAAGAAKEDDDG